MAKSVSKRPAWLKSSRVSDIYSVSGCISENFANYIPYWQHNGWWLFDSPEVIRRVARENSINLDNMSLFYYEAFENEFDHGAWRPIVPESAFKTNVSTPVARTLAGFDIVTFVANNAPECSPLSCNSLAETIQTNEHCLFGSFKEAEAVIQSGAFNESEPGPRRIFSVFSAEWPIVRPKSRRKDSVLTTMPTYISLIRGINVGGHGKVPMKQLQAMFEGLGFEQVRTLIQSGNVVFKAAKTSTSALSKKIESTIAAEFGFITSVVTRTTDELAKAIEQSPFVKESKAEPNKVHIAFLAEASKPEAAKKLEAMASATQRLRCGGREVYLHYRDGMGQAKLTGAVIERVLGVKATARNWNTITKLYEMARSPS